MIIKFDLNFVIKRDKFEISKTWINLLNWAQFEVHLFCFLVLLRLGFLVSQTSFN